MSTAIVATEVRPLRAVSNERVHAVLGAAVAISALFALIAWSYYAQVSVVYGYEGYLRRPPDAVWMVAHLFLALLPLSWLPHRPERASTVTLWIMYLFTVVPICAVVPLIPVSNQATSALFAAWSVAFLSLASLGQLVRLPQILPSPMTGARGRRWFAAGAALLAILLIRTFGLPLHLVTLSGAYEQRLAFRAALAEAPPAFGYLVAWSQSVVAPLILVSGIARRRPSWIAAGVAFFLWGFLINGSRQAIAATPFAVLLYLAGSRRVTGKTYAVGALLMLALSSILYGLSRNAYALGLIAERIFAVPGVLSAYYYDYFLGRSPVLLRDGIFSAASPSPYPRDMTYVIGDLYLGRADANANANVIADAFGNLWFGGLIAALVLAFVLWLLDAVTADLPLGPTMASLCLVLLALSNVGLTVVILTSGLGLMIVLYWLVGASLLTRD
ncbi:MAG TPA: hypothetical protein VE487_03860 [Ilumatobacter sp.]|nr:hypothetical protein [Ilumatobacter sp.]